ncbi:MAG: sugar kinase [Actinomycetales bacterium]|nr:sugar kinase [Actinomycetales bacterium]MCP4893789.1 sugar kinase [Actinomycetales bacterium]
MVQIASIGVHIIDVLGRPVSEIPPGQNIALIDEIRVTVAGTAGGTAVDLAKLGADVSSMGATGDDELGKVMRGILERYGIDSSGMRTHTDVPTSATMLPIRPNGERPALHVMGANAVLSAKDIDLSALGAFDVVHVGGTFLMPAFDGPDAALVLAAAKEQGATTTMDVLGVQKDGMADILRPCMPYLDYFMPNIEEAEMVSSLSTRSDLAGFFLDMGATTVILKMGDQGASIHRVGEAELRVPAFAVEVVDTTGCGDAFDAGFMLTTAMGWDVEQAACFGAACGSLVATGLGSDAGIVDFDSTRAFMETSETIPLVD